MINETEYDKPSDDRFDEPESIDPSSEMTAIEFYDYLKQGGDVK